MSPHRVVEFSIAATCHSFSENLNMQLHAWAMTSLGRDTMVQSGVPLMQLHFKVCSHWRCILEPFASRHQTSRQPLIKQLDLRVRLFATRDRHCRRHIERVLATQPHQQCFCNNLAVRDGGGVRECGSLFISRTLNPEGVPTTKPTSTHSSNFRLCTTRPFAPQG